MFSLCEFQNKKLYRFVIIVCLLTISYTLKAESNISINFDDDLSNAKDSVCISNSEYIYGDWSLTKHISIPWMIGCDDDLTKEQSDAWINETVSFSRKRVKFVDSECLDFKINYSKENTAQYMWDNYRRVMDTISGNGTCGVDYRLLGMEAGKILIAEIECSQKYYSVFVLNKNELILAYKGSFFKLIRIN